MRRPSKFGSSARSQGWQPTRQPRRTTIAVNSQGSMFRSCRGQKGRGTGRAAGESAGQPHLVNLAVLYCAADEHQLANETFKRSVAVFVMRFRCGGRRADRQVARIGGKLETVFHCEGATVDVPASTLSRTKLGRFSSLDGEFEVTWFIRDERLDHRRQLQDVPP